MNISTDKIKAIIASTFNIPISEVADDSSNLTIPQWDSIGHINLIFALEEHFKTSFTVDEIMTMREVAAIQKILDSDLS